MGRGSALGDTLVVKLVETEGDGEREARVEAVPEREGDADTEGLTDTLMERLLVTEEEQVGLNCREGKLQDSGQLHAVGAKEPAGQKKPLGHAMGLPTLLGQ
jgi:hypothetical protein